MPMEEGVTQYRPLKGNIIFTQRKGTSYTEEPYSEREHIGFRPNRGCHDALQLLDKIVNKPIKRSGSRVWQFHIEITDS